jgi:hypothetical protein
LAHILPRSRSTHRSTERLCRSAGLESLRMRSSK